MMDNPLYQKYVYHQKSIGESVMPENVWEYNREQQVQRWLEQIVRQAHNEIQFIDRMQKETLSLFGLPVEIEESHDKKVPKRTFIEFADNLIQKQEYSRYLLEMWGKYETVTLFKIKDLLISQWIESLKGTCAVSVHFLGLYNNWHELIFAYYPSYVEARRFISDLADSQETKAFETQDSSFYRELDSAGRTCSFSWTQMKATIIQQENDYE